MHSHHKPQHTKRANYCLFLLVLCTFVLLPKTSMAGPWSKKPGHLYLKLGQAFYTARDFVTAQQSVQKGAEYFGTQTSLYAEVGLFYGFQLQGFVPFHYGQIYYQDTRSLYRLNGPGDAVVGLQWTPPPLQKALGFPMAVRFNVKLPMFDVGKAAQDGGESAAFFPTMSDGQVDFTTWLSAGGPLPKLPLYLFAEVGYRFRTELFLQGMPVFQRSQPDTPLQFLDAFVFRARLGWNFAKKMMATVTFSGEIPLGQDEVSKGHINLGFGLYFPIAHGLAVEASLDPNVWAQSAARGASIMLGLSYNR